MVTFNPYAQITIATGSLTGGNIVSAASLSNNGYAQNVTAAVQATVAAPTGNIASLVNSDTGTLTFNVYNPTGSATRRDILIQAFNGGTNITGGTFTLTISGNTTAPIAYNASFAEVQSAINALGIGSFTVANFYGNANTSILYYAITFSITWERSAATGGTYTLTAFSQTTAAIAYNATASDVQTALNLLSNVAARGNVTVSGTLLAGFTIAFSNAVLSSTATSLTPSGSTIAIVLADDYGRTQAITFSSNPSRVLYSGGHGLTTSSIIYVKGASYWPLTPGAFGVIDGNTISLNSQAVGALTDAGTITEIGPRTVAGYTPGTALTRINRVTQFYLPGVSPGIDDADDIPLPVYEGNPTSLLTAIFARSTSINYQVGELERWLNSQILMRAITTINATQL